MIEFIKFDSFDKSKKNILVNYTLNFSSNYAKHSSKIYAKYFEIYKNEYNIILFGTIKTKKYFLKYANDFQSFNALIYLDIDLEVDNWNNYLDNLNFDLPIKIEKVFEIGGLLNTNFYRNKENELNKLTRNECKSYSKFLSIRNNILLFYFIWYILKKYNLTLYHLIYDPGCCDYSKFNCFNGINYNRFFLYDSKIFNFKRLDIFLYYYQKNTIQKGFLNLLNIEKNIDLTVGYSINTKKRLYFEKYDNLLNSINNKRIFIKNKYKNIDTFIDKESYINFIKKSYCTLILPAYDNMSFSYIRFLESIAFDCIPLIHKDCFINEAFDNENIDYLIVDETNIYDKLNYCKDNHLQIINELKNKFINKKLILKVDDET